MSYPVEEIEGIGAAYAEKLVAIGIRRTDDLLAQCALPWPCRWPARRGCRKNFCSNGRTFPDLMRIKGVGSRHRTSGSGWGRYRPRATTSKRGKPDGENAAGKRDEEADAPTADVQRGGDVGRASEAAAADDLSLTALKVLFRLSLDNAVRSFILTR